jgi:4a-hydroxytetrahydrobiopterin dehydratase
LFNSSMSRLTVAQIRALRPLVPGWKRRGAVLSRTFEFRDFSAAMKFVNAVARLAEKAWHHPDIDVRWNRVRLALTTHDAGGLTEKDFVLAQAFDRLGK